jgi:uncharacterized membrane protein YbaN (DUF454 family)
MASEPPETAWRPALRNRLARLSRPILLALGCVFLVVGLAGILLPLLPGTIFLILAAACFTRSSPRFERWLLDHPALGPPVRRWREDGSIPRRIKVFAGASIVASWLILLETDSPVAVKIGCLILFLGVIAYIASRPEGRGARDDGGAPPTPP